MAQKSMVNILSLLVPVVAVAVLTWSLAEASIQSRLSSSSFVPRSSFLQQGINQKKLPGFALLRCSGSDVLLSLRAGAIEEHSDEEVDEEETDDEAEEEEDVYDDDYDEYDVEEVIEVEETDGARVTKKVEYDEPLQAPASMQIGTAMAVIMLCRGHDLYQPKIVRIARFIFIVYMVLMQIFLAYVRIKARMEDDRTPVTLSNPLSSLVQSQLQQNGGNTGGDMVKDLASQFLSSKSTVYEYDLKQIKALNGSLLFNMVFMWILHFKMNRIQPLFIQSATGILNLFYNPLFQVYVLGRNLERPFKNPRLRALQERAEAEKATATAADAVDDVDEKEDADETVHPTADDEEEDESETEEDEAEEEEEIVEEEADDESENEDESDDE